MRESIWPMVALRSRLGSRPESLQRDSLPSRSAGPRLVRFPTWGGYAVLAAIEPAGLDAALVQVRRTIAAFDRACSSFRDDSELARLNASPGEEVVVGPVLFRAVREALRAARLTGGAVDPTVGQTLIAHGINPPLNGQTMKIARAPGWATIKFDEAAHAIRLPLGVQLDLGATAKALAADIAAAAASAAAGCGVLVGLCGDIAVAGDPPDAGWKVRVSDDHRDGNAPGQTVTIRSGGLATSSVTVRRTGHVHHLVDPLTGRPVEGPWRTVSVSADSCLDANTASTAAIVLGSAAPNWLQTHCLPARLVGQGGEIHRVAGWPAGDGPGPPLL